MDPILLLVIVTFGLIFVILSSLCNGLSNTPKSIKKPLSEHRGGDILLVVGNFIVIPALIIGLVAIVPFDPQIKAAFCVLALTAGAPFVPLMVKIGKGDIAYAVGAVMLLTIVTFIVLPLGLPLLLNALGTNITISTWIVAWPLILFMIIPLLAGLYIRGRNPELAATGVQHLAPISLVALLVHVTLYAAAFLGDLISLGGTGAIALMIAFPIIAMVIGVVLKSPEKSPASLVRGLKLVSAVAMAQRNTGACICTLIFALGAYAVTGVTVLLSSIITIMVVIIAMSEVGARYTKKQEAATIPNQTSSK
jgi:bile acid:Na+ symporter, BASS family